MKKSFSTKRFVIIALFLAIMTTLTTLISIPVANFGYINLSDALILLLATVEDIPFLLMVGGVGTSLADLLLGFGQYAPVTFLAKSLEGILVYFIRKKCGFRSILLPYLFGAGTMVLIYALADVIFASSWTMFLPSFLTNLPQGVICVVLALLLKKSFIKLLERVEYESR